MVGGVAGMGCRGERPLPSARLAGPIRCSSGSHLDLQAGQASPLFSMSRWNFDNHFNGDLFTVHGNDLFTFP